MREILFRGKRNDNGKWVEGSLILFRAGQRAIAQDDYDNTCFYPSEEEDFTYWDIEHLYMPKVNPETISQFTGLTDKNGKKIFEGDIVLFEDESPANYEYHDCTETRCGTIEYGDNCFYITNRIAVEMEDLIYDGKLDVEVIGNIHDNPELLGGVQQALKERAE